MSEQINKILASTAQAFTTAEQAQARANIGAQKSIAYSYSDGAITAIDGSAIGQTGALAEVYHDGNLSGSGTELSPLGLSTGITLSMESESATLAYNLLKIAYGEDGDPVLSATNGAICISGHAGNASSPYTAEYGLPGMGVSGHNSFAGISASASVHYSGAEFHQGNESAMLNASSLRFTDSSNHSAQVDISSIDRWNANVWNESGNSLSTGIGGSRVSAASQYNFSGNWAARTVEISGGPGQTMYGFQSQPTGTGTFGVTRAGAFVEMPQQNYFTYLFHATGADAHTFGQEIYPDGLTADARLDFVNLCSAASANVLTDTYHGSTANISPGESATMWYIAAADAWTDGSVPVPV